MNGARSVPTYQINMFLGLQLMNNTELAVQVIQYFNRAEDYFNIRSPDAVYRAIELYNKAITLGKELPLNVDDNRNTLANAYSSLGYALLSLGSHEAFETIGTFDAVHQATESYSKAISIREELPINVDENRRALARDYCNLGSALFRLTTTDAYHQAIDGYNKAITLGKGLSVSVEENCRALFKIYTNFGSDLFNNIGNADATDKAIECHNKAIRLGKMFPLILDDDRRLLAISYYNLGNSLIRSENLNQAIEAFKNSLETLPKSTALRWKDYRIRPYVLKGMATAKLNINTKELCVEALDDAESGLDLLVNYETAGFFSLRPLREDLFEIVIDAYMRVIPEFIPEFLIRHLDPKYLGSAPQSESMHENAINALRFCYSWAGHAEQEVRDKVSKTAERLSEIRKQYFTGSINGARLTSIFYEQCSNNLRKAEELLLNYTNVCPSDPAGFQQLGDFYFRHGKNDKSLKIYEKAITAIIDSIPTEISTSIFEERIEALLKAVEQGTNVLLDEYPNNNNKWNNFLFNRRFSTINTWIGKREHQFEDFFHQGKIPKSFLQKLLTGLADLRNSYLEKQMEWQSLEHRNLAKELQAKWVQAHKNQSQMLFKILSSGFQQAWGVVGERFSNALKEVWQQIEEISEEATEAEKIEREEEILDGLSRRAGDLSRELSDAKIEQAAETLKQNLGFSLWNELLEDEKKFLAVACCYIDGPLEDIKTLFAGHCLGMAFETSLKERIFKKIKDNSSTKTAFASTLEGQGDFKPIAQYFKGTNTKLYLQHMTRALGTVIEKFPEQPQTKVEQFVTNFLNELPAPEKIFASNLSARTRRKDVLTIIREVRNSCAHPKQPPLKSDLLQAWHGAVEDKEDGFYRYFIEAHLRKENLQKNLDGQMDLATNEAKLITEFSG